MGKKPPPITVRRPPPAPDAEAFVRGGAAPDPAAPPEGRRTYRRGGRELRRVCAYLPVDLARRLAVFAAEHDTDVSRVLAVAVARYLDKPTV